MAQRTCAHCGEMTTRKYCSDRCKWASRPRIPCAECGEPSGYPIGRGPESPVCRPCRNAGAVTCGTASGYRQGCRCSACTEAQRESIRTYAAKRRAEGRPLHRQRAEVERVCVGCTSAFSVRSDLAQVYCSLACLGVSRRVDPDVVRFTIPKAVRLAIYERDKWVCQICKEPVAPDALHLSDWAPTLDHIMPRSQGGSDTQGNLRLAHRWCNSVRGDLTYYTDADLAS